jgi:hypothetical protein
MALLCADEPRRKAPSAREFPFGPSGAKNRRRSDAGDELTEPLPPLTWAIDVPIVPAMEVRNSADGLRALAGDSKQLLFVVNRPFYWRADGKEFLAHTLRPHYRLSKTLTFQYFVIYVFDRV